VSGKLEGDGKDMGVGEVNDMSQSELEGWQSCVKSAESITIWKYSNLEDNEGFVVNRCARKIDGLREGGASSGIRSREQNLYLNARSY
jgi:hypothetical protein